MLTATFEVFGVGHNSVNLTVFALGWSLGWLLLWRTRTLPAHPTAARPPVAVIIPARDEAHALPHLLRPLVEQRRTGDRIVVVDDHSTDATACVARDVRRRRAHPTPRHLMGGSESRTPAGMVR